METLEQMNEKNQQTVILTIDQVTALASKFCADSYIGDLDHKPLFKINQVNGKHTVVEYQDQFDQKRFFHL